MDGETERRRRWPRVLLALLGVVAVALAGLWLVRKPLATRYADRFLAEKGVPARYRIADLGLGRQRLVNVVLGDPADPDLVADWLEARTAVGLSGPYLTGVRGGHVRVRGRWANGTLSLGSLDRLIPKGEAGKPFALPALDLDLDDLRARVDTPWGVVGAKLSGSGPLDGGFDGRLAVTAARLGDACGAAAPRAALRVTTRADAVRLAGSAEVGLVACADASARYANLNGAAEVTLGRAIGWTLDADVAAQGLRQPAATAADVAGRVKLRGGERIGGDVALTARQVAGHGVTAEAARMEGAVLHDPAGRVAFAYRGTLGWTAARYRLGAIPGGTGTPIEPLLRQANAGLLAAARRFDGEAAVYLATGPAGTQAQLQRASVRAASGAQLAFDGGEAGWLPGEGLRVDGTARLAGGGLPTLSVTFDPAGPDAFRGLATMQPYAAGDARLALTPVRFTVGGDGGRLRTDATLSGPMAGGRVEALTVPLDLRWRGGTVALAGGCLPVAWQRVAVSGLVLDPATLRLCGGDTLVRVANGRVTGGATLAATRLTGRLGSTPLVLAATGARLELGGSRFGLSGVTARLGQSGRVSTFSAGRLDGALVAGGVAGSFADAGGRIGAVPLVMSDAAGSWRFAGGTLGVTGELTVSDAQTDRPHLKPLPVRDIALTLRGNAIKATGTVRAPGERRTVATVRLAHDLARGTGAAAFAVPALVFDKELQPDQLTPVTFGVVADVRGTVTGEGRIDWSPAGVISTGAFTTEGIDLAAAFGPVQGIAGTIRFTDLLALQSAPGQVFTVRQVNPGIAVSDGTVTFQTLPNARVAVAGARWPFAGGTLTLLPTLLDFGAQAARRLTFRVDGAAADQFLQQFDFDNLNATGTFDGELPMVFDQAGGRIENGRLQVRPGGGTIAYAGAISQKDVGFWPNLAFQALKSLRYRSLSIQMNGPLAGEMVTEVRFAGVSQGEGASRGGIAGLLVRRLQRLPFVFNIRIEAPFRGLLDATASFYDPKRLIQRNLPQLIEEQNKRAAPPGGPPAAKPPTTTPAKAGAQLQDGTR